MMNLKRTLSITLLAIISTAFCSCSGHHYTIKTEYGDVFYAYSDYMNDDAFIGCSEHDFELSMECFESKSDLTPVCDTEYFRCYHFCNSVEDFYICGLKPDGKYYWIDADKQYSSGRYPDLFSDELLKVFLADKYIMQVTLNLMDGKHHGEIMDIAQKLTSGNYEGLNKYGLTEKMINDKESLDEKIGIMEEYLKTNQAQGSA